MDDVEDWFVVDHGIFSPAIEEVLMVVWKPLFDLLELLVLLGEGEGEEVLLFWLHYINYNINTRLITTLGSPPSSAAPAWLGPNGSCCRCRPANSSYPRPKDIRPYRWNRFSLRWWWIAPIVDFRCFRECWVYFWSYWPKRLPWIRCRWAWWTWRGTSVSIWAGSMDGPSWSTTAGHALICLSSFILWGESWLSPASPSPLSNFSPWSASFHWSSKQVFPCTSFSVSSACLKIRIIPTWLWWFWVCTPSLLRPVFVVSFLILHNSFFRAQHRRQWLCHYVLNFLYLRCSWWLSWSNLPFFAGSERRYPPLMNSFSSTQGVSAWIWAPAGSPDSRRGLFWGYLSWWVWGRCPGVLLADGWSGWRWGSAGG